MSKLLDSAGRPVPRADVVRAHMTAMLNVPEGQGAPQGEWGSPWAYDAQAWFSQDFGQWFPQVRSPDAEINVDRDRTVARIRDLTRNDGWAGGVISTMADAAVGVTMSPLPEPNFGVLQRQDKRLDAVWADEFSAAIENETDVPPAVLASTLGLFSSHSVRALVYNEQTTGPQTQQVLAAAKAAGIPVVTVSETLPAGVGYVEWMQRTVTALHEAVTR